MSEPYGLPSIQIVPGPPTEWARRHPSFFFASGVPSSLELLEQLVEGARVLSSMAVEVVSLGEWQIVASTDDWFNSAKHQETEAPHFEYPKAFPELGQNCTRPEFVVAAFAQAVVFRGPRGVCVVKGTIEPADPMLVKLSTSHAWQRAIAFRGLHA